MEQYVILYLAKDKPDEVTPQKWELYRCKSLDDAINHGIKQAEKMYVVTCIKHYFYVFHGKDQFIDSYGI